MVAVKEKLLSFLYLSPTTNIGLPGQGTWLTRPDPRPEIESTLPYAELNLGLNFEAYNL